MFHVEDQAESSNGKPRKSSTRNAPSSEAMTDTVATSWQQGPSNALSNSVDLDDLRKRMHGMSDAELIIYGKRMRDLVYPLRYGGDGKPVECAFSIQLSEARAEWRWRHPARSGLAT
jgi:hypothetical protein